MKVICELLRKWEGECSVKECETYEKVRKMYTLMYFPDTIHLPSTPVLKWMTTPPTVGIKTGEDLYF
jgi:hypothetical protein